MDTWQANRAAVGAEAKAVCEALRHLGKRCSLRWVYYQTEPARDVTRVDPYGAFWRWFEAIWRANRSGAEFLFEDFRSRVLAIRAEEEFSHTDWDGCLDQCEAEHSDVIRAIFRGEDLARLKQEIAQDIAVKRRLLAMVAAREARTVTKASACGRH